MSDDATKPAAPQGASKRPRASKGDAKPATAAAVSPADQPARKPVPSEVVEATSVSIVQGGAATVHAGSIDIRQGGIARATADDIAIHQGGIAIARGEHVSTEFGGTMLTLAGEARLSQSFASQVIARDATFDQSLVQTVVAGRATFRHPSAVFVLIAGRVDGPVRPVLDWRGGLAAGAVIGLILGVLRRRR